MFDFNMNHFNLRNDYCDYVSLEKKLSSNCAL